MTLGTADRAMAIYDALIKACEARQWSVTVTESEHGSVTAVHIGGEQVGILIEERVQRTEKPRDPKDTRTYWRQFDHVPTGRLTVRLQVQYLDVRQSWSDGAKQRVEDCLNAIMVDLVAAAEALKVQRLEREARHKEYLAAEERRRLAEERRQQEAARIRALGADLTAWRKATIVREYAAAMRKSAEAAGQLGDGAPMTAWLAWVDEYADRIDPTTGTPSVPSDPQPNTWARYGQTAGASESERFW